MHKWHANESFIEYQCWLNKQKNYAPRNMQICFLQLEDNDLNNWKHIFKIMCKKIWIRKCSKITHANLFWIMKCWKCYWSYLITLLSLDIWYGLITFNNKNGQINLRCLWQSWSYMILAQILPSSITSTTHEAKITSCRPPTSPLESLFVSTPMQDSWKYVIINWGNFVTSTFIGRLSTTFNMYNMFWIISKSFVQWATPIRHCKWVIHGNISKNTSFLN